MVIKVHQVFLVSLFAYGLAEKIWGVNLEQYKLLSIWADFKLLLVVVAWHSPGWVRLREIEKYIVVIPVSLVVTSNWVDWKVFDWSSGGEKIHHLFEFPVFWLFLVN